MMNFLWSCFQSDFLQDPWDAHGTKHRFSTKRKNGHKTQWPANGNKDK